MAKTDDVFTVFISHKHDDHALAVEVKIALEGLVRPKLIDCFVSGIDITAGMDWRREIRSVLARSHLLVLLYTTPSNNWDWCLYETGLYTRFEKDSKNEVSSVVCLFSPGQASPSAIADLQGVPAETDKVRDFLNLLCRQTWKISDDWRQGALAPDVEPKQVDHAARVIEKAFRRLGATSTYFPCHRVVLSFSESDNIASGIPESALVMEGPNDTSSYTLSLFDLASGPGKRTWGDLEGRFAYEGLERVIHEKARLGVLTSLVAHPKGLVFADLKRLCGLTDGNLSRHLQVLLEAGLVDILKGYEHNRPQMICRITAKGRRRFLSYLAVLEQVVQDAAEASREVSSLAEPARA